MRVIKQSLRFIKIYYVFLKYGLDRALLRLPLLKAFKFIVWFNPFYWHLRKLQLSRGERLTLALEQLGPIFVKLGQLLSTRRDVLPPDIVLTLSKLQDQVKAFNTFEAQALIETALDGPLTQIFANFNPTPLASASIAQVYAATLPSGEDVIVKVLRPNVHEEVSQDLAILRWGAFWLELFSKTLQRFNLKSIVLELERTLNDELDLIKEAANASQLKRNFSHRTGLHIPQVYWRYCRKNVLVMERIYGIPILNKEELLRRGFDLKTVGEKGLTLFYTQVFEDSFFHADLHPGNLFINPANVATPEWMLVDFGIVGTLSKENQRYLAANFLAFIDRDYRRVAELHLESGWVPNEVRVDILEAAIRSVCEPIFELPQQHISIGQTLFRLLLIARQFNMEVMPEMLLLQKSLISIEGVVKNLDPNINIWAIARPILARWMKHQVGIRSITRAFRKELPLIIDKLPELPGLLYQVLKQKAHPTPPTKNINEPKFSQLKWLILLPIITLIIGLCLGLYVSHLGP
jgi:ubiquinone biosynthesis protein